MLNVVGELREEVMMSSTARYSINIALWGKGPECARSEVTFLESWKHLLPIAFCSVLCYLCLCITILRSLLFSCNTAHEMAVTARLHEAWRVSPRCVAHEQNDGVLETVLGTVGTVVGTVVETVVNYIGTVRFLCLNL